MKHTNLIAEYFQSEYYKWEHHLGYRKYKKREWGYRYTRWVTMWWYKQILKSIGEDIRK